jgi:hypothetical protein
MRDVIEGSDPSHSFSIKSLVDDLHTDICRYMNKAIEVLTHIDKFFCFSENQPKRKSLMSLKVLNRGEKTVNLVDEELLQTWLDCLMNDLD